MQEKLIVYTTIPSPLGLHQTASNFYGENPMNGPAEIIVNLFLMFVVGSIPCSAADCG